ncbi:hypothetical protein IAT40_002958 [Kwoniella sp. CBS 6097]
MSSVNRRSDSPPTDASSNKRLKTDCPKIFCVNKPYQSEHADITLISSDGLPFKVHSYHLKSASSVFRAMLEIADSDSSSPEVTLTDEAIEHSIVLRIFLDIVHGISLRKPEHCWKEREYECVVAFLKKYEATSALEVVRLSLISWASHGDFMHLEIFILGTMLSDVELCKAAITSPGKQKWDETDYEGDPGDPITGNRNVMDLSAAPLEYLKKIPDDYKWALMRASSIATTRYCVWAKADKIDPKLFADDKVAVARKFEQLMKDARH